MGEFIDEARRRALLSRSRSAGPQPFHQADDPARGPVPDSWIAALLLPVIIGCVLFAATSP
jgi:hypothetical protein